MPVAQLTYEEDRARAVLRALLGIRQITGAELGRRIGVGRSLISDKIAAKSRIGVTDIEQFAAALGVEPSVFFLEPEQAIRWVLDHEADGSAPTPIGRRAASGKEIALTTWEYHNYHVAA